MRFRAKQYATTSDLEKAFLQIQLDEKDRDATRFLWLSDPTNTSSPLITYRFKSVLFGATCSPFILSATLLKHLKENPGPFATKARIIPLEIKSLCGDNVWRYCPTKDNPADLLTRGITSEELQQNEMWFSGPKWLNSKEDWPTWNGNNVTSSVCTTMSENDDKIETMEKNQNVCIGIGEIIDIERYNSYTKLTRITAYVMRFATNCRATETERKKDLLRSDEIKNAKFLWIRYTQGKIFSDEINCIDNSTKRKTLVRQLKLFLDEKQLLRCGGRRIDNATVGETVKFPYLLPAKDRLTHLIVLEAHENTLHSGINITLAYIQQTFWIPKLRQCVKSILSKCVTCRKVIGKSYPAPEIPPLPNERVQDATPFSITGVDFTGALTTRNRHNEESKVYICLFTCAVTRAVHLEVVYDLSEESFLLCFRRFVSR
ncbi:uncharacterized protein LOC134699358 [Mytilus trossulus]|uniref:uncharacterized protein LOC134699358 n=1 Tax=Mytilus trossulus TaxID=6551 RepID=UPI0030067917